MASSVDALGTFSYLQINVPAWITLVSRLAEHAATKDAEYLKAYRRYAACDPHSSSLPRRKSSSVCSMYNDELVLPVPREGSQSEAAEKAIPQAARDRPTYNPQADRMRGTGEAPSSLDLNDQYYFGSARHKSNIEYDGHIQKILNKIVKDIGIARNNIRRGKMAMITPSGQCFGLLKWVAPRTDNAAGEEESSALSTLAYLRSTRISAGILGVTGSTENRKQLPLDYVDKQLKLAHRLCETAAYQALRLGHCGGDIFGLEEKLMILLSMVNKEMARLTNFKQKREERVHLRLNSIERAPQEPRLSPGTQLTRITAISQNAIRSSISDSVAAIEVDDVSSISTESIGLSA
ncbi:hypothetical protein N7451_012005 [Penicillium sp. IBT 35674x]|nr:hypothetical protein N7451_012005 [Penicillium sp. IBT 35674x]